MARKWATRERVVMDRAAAPLAVPSRDGTFPSITVFTATGCHHRLGGGCLLCDYGICPDATSERILGDVRQLLDRLAARPPVPLFGLFTSGSVLDPRELSPDLRDRLVDLAIGLPGLDELHIESRPEFVSDAVIAELATRLRRRNIRLAVGLGLESTSDLVRDVCVHKRAGTRAYQRAIDVLHGNGATAVVNLILKPPLLTEAESIDDARRSIAEAWQMGANFIVLFAGNVKVGTFAHTLAGLDLPYPCRYRPPHLRSVAEVVGALEPDLCRRVLLHGISAEVPVQRYAEACPRCEPALLRAIETFNRRSPDTEIRALPRCSCYDEFLSQDEDSARPLDLGALERRLKRIEAALRRAIH